jgi:hypothetical protein
MVRVRNGRPRWAPDRRRSTCARQRDDGAARGRGWKNLESRNGKETQQEVGGSNPPAPITEGYIGLFRVAGAHFPCERFVSSRFGAGRRVASRRSAVANVAWSW